MVSYQDVERRNTRTSCWVVVSGKAYDVTDLLNNHPGGAEAILRHAGRDATEDYELFHAPGTIEKELPPEKQLGPVTGSPSAPSVAKPKQQSAAPVAETSPSRHPLPLSACLSLDDIEQAGRLLCSPPAAAYFYSAADTLTSMERNRYDWTRIGLRQRVLRDVSKVSMRCQIMGSPVSLPIFIAPAAVARLGHEDGEKCLARGAARMDIAQCVCTYSSVPVSEVVECFNTDPHRRGGALFFQLYIPKEKHGAERLIHKARELGFKALIVTVDSPVIGKRDGDERFKALRQYDGDPGTAQPLVCPPLPGQEAETLRGAHCSNFTWDDLPWIRKLWGSKPIILKGIQTAEDALEATRYGVQGIYLSNHGGRQLDYAPSSVKTLLEIRRRCPEVFDKVEVYVDGGVSRGSDVVKALCLGARGVGLGRAFLSGLSAYGDEGVLKTIQILSDEIQTTMRLLGVTDLSQLGEEYIDVDTSYFNEGMFPRRRLGTSAKL